MADNVPISAGSGTVIHADEYTHTTLGSGNTQLVKLVDGTLDSDTAIGVPDIGAKANAIRVCPANDVTDGTYIGDIKFGENLPGGTIDTVTTITNDVSIDDGGNSITIDNATLSVTGGGVEASALRVTIANDSTGVLSIDDGGGAITVDNGGTFAVQSTLQTGSATIGKLAANSGVDIGDVDVTSCDGIAAEDTALGNGVLIQGDDGTDRKNINVDATTGDVQVDVTNTVTVDCNSSDITIDNAAGASAVNIQDGGNSITVDGTITETNSTAILADTANMDTNLGTIAGDTTSIDGKITACNTGAVVLAASDGTDIGNVDVASIAAGTNVIGKIRLVTATGDEITEDTDDSIQVTIVADDVGIGGGTQYTEDAAAAANPTGNAQICVRQDTPAGLTTADGDNVARRATDYGAAFCQILDSSGNFIDTFGGSGGTAAADDADFTAGTTQGTPAMGVYESSPTSVTDGDLGTVGITSTRSLKVEETNSTAILADTANMDTNLGTLAGAVSGSEMQVDIVADGAGLATAANQSTVIGHLDGVEGSLTDIETNTDFGAVVGEGTITASTLRVTIATDDDGVAHLATIAGDTTSLDGKVTACNTGAVVLSSGTVTTVSTVTNLSQLGGAAIDMNEGTIGTGTQRVTLATDDDGVAHLATIAGDTTNIETSIQVIDDWDATHDSAAASDGPQIMAAYDSTKPTAVGDGDAVRLLADSYGRLLPGVEPQFWSATINSADASSATQVKAAGGAGTRHYITSIIISCGSAMNVQIQDDAGTPNVAIENKYFAANGGLALAFPTHTPIQMGADNQDIDVLASTSGNISVTLTGYTI